MFSLLSSSVFKHLPRGLPRTSSSPLSFSSTHPHSPLFLLSLIKLLFFPISPSTLRPVAQSAAGANLISVIITARPLKLMLRVADTVAEIVSGVHFLHLHVLQHFKPFDSLPATPMVQVTGGGDGATTAGQFRKLLLRCIFASSSIG